MWTTKIPCSSCSSRGCCGLRKGGLAVTTPFQLSQRSLNASSDLGACSPRALSSVAVSEGPGGPQSLWPWSRAAPLRITGGGKSERSNLCFWLADGLPYAGLGLRPLPERSIHPTVPHIRLWVEGGAAGVWASWANPPPPTPSCSCPPSFPCRCPAVTLFPHVIAKWAHSCSICQREGRRHY